MNFEIIFTSTNEKNVIFLIIQIHLYFESGKKDFLDGVRLNLDFSNISLSWVVHKIRLQFEQVYARFDFHSNACNPSNQS